MNDPGRYDVALSFAGQERKYVQAVADELRDAGIKVFYDDYEKVTLWGKDLYTHLDWVYRKASRYCIIFVSKSYAEKVWTNHERSSAQARAIEEHREYVLPVRFDDTAIPGLRPTISYLDIADVSPEELAHMIEEKLGPQQVRPGLPRKYDRLYSALNLKGKGARDAKREVRDVVASLYQAFERMTLDERTVVGATFIFGCVGELPEGVHISLDYLARMTQMPKAQIMESLSSVRSLNIRVVERDSQQIHPRSEGELVSDDSDLLASFWAPRAPGADDATEIARTALSQAARHFCSDHGLEVIRALDFHRLSGDESGPISMPAHQTEGDTADDDDVACSGPAD